LTFDFRPAVSNRTKLITQKSGLKSLTGKELVNNQYVINSVQVLTRFLVGGKDVKNRSSGL